MLHLIVALAGQRVALSCAGIDAVVDIGAIVPTPLADRHVVGVAALRSRVVTVIDPARILKPVGGSTPPGRAVVSSEGGHGYAVLIDAVEDAVQLSAEPVPAGVAFGADWSRMVTGVVRHEGDTLPVLSLSQLIAGPDAAIQPLAA